MAAWGRARTVALSLALVGTGFVLSGCGAGHDGDTGVFVSTETGHLTAIFYGCNSDLTVADVVSTRAQSLSTGSLPPRLRWDFDQSAGRGPVEIDLDEGASNGASLVHGALPLTETEPYSISAGESDGTVTTVVVFTPQDIRKLTPGLIYTASPTTPDKYVAITRQQFLSRTCH